MKFLLPLLFLALPAQAQKQANIWYFGDHAGLDFNQVPAKPVYDGQTYINSGHGEGTSVICDPQGKLLFYSNGENIWNSQHKVMPNGSGLKGHYSSSQSVLIVPKPGSSRYYYVFTTDSWYENDLKNGLCYSVVDICLDNGKGDVMPNLKNLKLLDLVSEKLTAVRHSNGRDIWIITHKYTSDEFYAFLITKQGIKKPIISACGSSHAMNCNPPSTYWSAAAIGCMKASPNGRKLALASMNNCNNLKELFDFDPLTGKVSNFVDLELGLDTFGGYSMSFSPDNTKLYLSNGRDVLQYTLQGTAAHIRASKVVVSTTQYGSYCGIQLGPDGKIYVARAGKNWLSVIEYPNKSGAACGFVFDGIDFIDKKVSMGLPNLMDSYNYQTESLISCGEPLIDSSTSSFTPVNVITPNGDNINDWFDLNLGDVDVENYQLMIYNRWGNLMSESRNSKEQWDGTCNGSKVPAGTYFWMLEFTDPKTGETISKTGVLHVMY